MTVFVQTLCVMETRFENKNSKNHWSDDSLHYGESRPSVFICKASKLLFIVFHYLLLRLCQLTVSDRNSSARFCLRRASFFAMLSPKALEVLQRIVQVHIWEVPNNASVLDRSIPNHGSGIRPRGTFPHERCSICRCSMQDVDVTIEQNR